MGNDGRYWASAYTLHLTHVLISTLWSITFNLCTIRNINLFVTMSYDFYIYTRSYPLWSAYPVFIDHRYTPLGSVGALTHILHIILCFHIKAREYIYRESLRANTYFEYWRKTRVELHHKQWPYEVDCVRAVMERLTLSWVGLYMQIQHWVFFTVAMPTIM